MAKVRVHELAKSLGMTAQDLLKKLRAVGMVLTASSSIDEEEANQKLRLSAPAAAPKTMIRRRKVEEQPVVEEVPEVVLPPEPVVAVTVQSEAKAEIEPEVKKTAELETPPIAELGKEEVVAPVATVPVEAPKPPVVVEFPRTGLTNNVVRVIDPKMIQQRLSSEGRSFNRSTPGVARRPTTIREVRVVSGAPSPAPQQTDAVKKAGWKPAKKKGRGADDQKERQTGGRELWLQSNKRKKSKGRMVESNVILTQPAAHKRVVEVDTVVTVQELAHNMSVKASQVIQKLMSMGMMATVNQTLDFDTASLIASEFNYEVKNASFEEKDLITHVADKDDNLKTRPPIVTVMGHVDHGKTSLLDALKKSNVAAGEAGGITQHIGAYCIETGSGLVTFLDTPGHEAFTAMRARGAKITDIVILVVAADDGIMPQTIEAINHAKAAKVPVIVAINKMDVVGAKPDRVLQQLADQGILAEEWGGDIQVFKVSALKKLGLEELLEGIHTQAEMLELKANPDKMAAGGIIEAKLDKGRGPVATMLPLSGTLKLGDHVVAGEYSGRIRAMYDATGKTVTEATPSVPVQVVGLSGVPMAGDHFDVVKDDKSAKVIVGHRAQKLREQELLQTSRVSLENFMKSNSEAKFSELRLIVKADVSGSVEALKGALAGLSTTLVKVSVVHAGVGIVTENDVNLAMASNATIVGFNVKADTKAQALATREKVSIKSYSVIYEVIDDVRASMAGLLEPIIEERYIGKAQVRMIIQIPKVGVIAGSYVLDGKIVRSSKSDKPKIIARITRGGKIIHESSISSLKRFKEDAKEVVAGQECGIGVDGSPELLEGDIIECYEIKKVAAVHLGEKLQNPEENKTTGVDGHSRV